MLVVDLAEASSTCPSARGALKLVKGKDSRVAGDIALDFNVNKADYMRLALVRLTAASQTDFPMLRSARSSVSSSSSATSSSSSARALRGGRSQAAVQSFWATPRVATVWKTLYLAGILADLERSASQGTTATLSKHFRARRSRHGESSAEEKSDSGELHFERLFGGFFLV
ncbi:hypothetical protein ACJQWK_03959 [Exserohilum turcicum]